MKKAIRRRRPPRNRSFKPEVRSGASSIFTEENTRPIVERFGFRAEYPLADQLNHAVDWHDDFKGKPAGRDVIKFLQEGATQAKVLHDWLDRLGFARAYILDVYDPLKVMDPTARLDPPHYP